MEELLKILLHGSLSVTTEAQADMRTRYARDFIST